MRISLINVNLVAQDAIGQCMLHQLRFFRRRGDEVRTYTLHPPEGVTEDIVELTRVVDLADLIARRGEHFARSDLYIYHYPGRYPLMESIKGLERGAVIFYYHNVTPPELWNAASDREALRHSATSVDELAYYADLVVTPSPFNAKQLVEEQHLERDQIRVLPLAVPLNDFSPGAPDPALVRFYHADGRAVVLFVGRMASNKRIDLLIEALSKVRHAVPGAMLMLVGDNDSNPAIKETVAHAHRKAADLGVADDVVFAGRVDDLPDYYRMASVYASASLHEGFGVPLIEAMASGLPVVASRTTAHPWVVNEAGLLAEPGDAGDMAEKILQVLTDDEIYGELVRRGLQRAREFSLEQYLYGWDKIVREATAWLPDQPYPRPQSVRARLVEPHAADAPTVEDVLFQGELGRLNAKADIRLRGYKIRSKIPIFGPLVTWFRRNLTSHLREPYIDPTFARQVAFNRELVDRLGWFIDQLKKAERRLAEQAARITTLERELAKRKSGEDR